MTTCTLKRLGPDAVRVFGAALAIAWQKYHRDFGDVPHGSLDQMAALIELAGGEKALLRIAAYVAQRKGAKRKGRRIAKRRIKRAASRLSQ
jgi:hypothetical protein